MVFKLGIAMATPFLLVAVLMGATGVVVVDVKEQDGMHLVIPVPLLLAQTALSFAPDEAKYVECPEFAPYRAMAERILEELADQPDFVMVEVEEGDEWVHIEKVGKELVIDVQEGDDQAVHVTVPIKSALRMIRSYDGTGFPTKAAIWSLRGAPIGTLVHVVDGDDTVKISRF